MTVFDPRDAVLCPSRRAFLASAGAFVAWANMPSFARAAARDPRFIVVILRGAMDGMAAVPPAGDPDYAALRTDAGVGADAAKRGLPLDGFFLLNAAMPRFHARYKAGEALVVHAVATPYRDRSHFDGQNVLETGMEKPRTTETGWLNRVAAALPAGDRAAPAKGLAVTPTVPLILRGAAPTLTWIPPNFTPPGADITERLADLYAHTDRDMARVFQAGIEADALAGTHHSEQREAGLSGAFSALTAGAARLVGADDGPRLAALSFDGWDTHVNEGANGGRLATALSALDDALDALAAGLGPVWRDTIVAVVTEFGRTAHGNGADGTDHGTATVALLMGGALKGGRVVADWPGLKSRQLYENRDLAPTTDLRAVFKGVLRDHLGLSERVLATDVFPGSIGLKGIDGLVV